MTRSAGLPDDVHARLSAYLDGELDAAARAEVEALLQRSPDARAAVEEMRRLDASLRSLPVLEPGDAYWQGFADRVASRLPTSPPPESLYERMTAWLFRGGRVAWLRAAGALAMLTLVAVFAVRGVRTPTPSPTPDAAAPQASAPAVRAPDLAARTSEMPEPAPPAVDAAAPDVAGFVNAALAGQRDVALAALARIERSQPGSAELASMHGWVAATEPPMASKAERTDRATETLALSETAPQSLPALQALDALVWPRRAANPAAAERLALQLEALAHADTTARPLARRYLAWLGEASPDSAAASGWYERLRALGG